VYVGGAARNHRVPAIGQVQQQKVLRETCTCTPQAAAWWRQHSGMASSQGSYTVYSVTIVVRCCEGHAWSPKNTKGSGIALSHTVWQTLRDQ
jgi:hypothetical protein